MKIRKALPPNYEDIIGTFPFVKDKPTIVFTYGDTIYAPGIKDEKTELPQDLLIHEGVHEKQQGKTPQAWWQQYLKDPQFRLSQEREAYGAQWNYINGLDVKRAGKDRFLDAIAADLSGPMYGNILTHNEAKSKIRNAAKVI